MAKYVRKTNNPRMGRPKKKINREEFEKLCAIQCTLVEIAAWFDCSEDTIENWCKETYEETFSEAHKKYSAPGKISLRRAQFQMAEHNCSMAIWLGKQYLGQKDIVEQNVKGASVVELIAKELIGGKSEDGAE